MSDTEAYVDLTNYRDRVGTRVSPGTYKVVVEDVEMDKSKAGNQMINLWFRITEGDFKDREVIDRLVLSEKSLFRVVGFLQALGVPTPKKRIRLNIASWVGRRLEILVEDGEPYNGRVKSEVRGYIQVDAPASAEADLADVEAPAPTPAPAAQAAAPTPEAAAPAPAAVHAPKAAAESADTGQMPGQMSIDDVPQEVELESLGL